MNIPAKCIPDGSDGEKIRKIWQIKEIEEVLIFWKEPI